MRKGLTCALILLGLAFVIAVGVSLWPHRPWRPVIVVNDQVLTAGELDLRAHTLLEDAKRSEGLLVPKEREEEALTHYRRQTAKMWIVKQVLLTEALARGFMAQASDEKDSFERITARLRNRGLTPEQFFKEGPLPEDLKRRDFQESILVDKFMAKEVRDKIVVTTKEINERQDELQQSSQTKKGETKISVSRKKAIDSLRVEKFRQGFRRLFQELYTKSDVKCPIFRELETLNGVMPERPENIEPRTRVEQP